MNLLDLIVGRPLKSSEERAEQIGPAQGIPIFGLDALSSAAYGPEAALSLLIPLGLLGVRYIVPVSAAIITLLVIVYFSYRQTIEAYPTGGGSYTVARFNLGTFWGLLAAAALMADYILTAAVGISAGVGALVSAVPKLLPHTLDLCLGILVVLTIINLRGVKEAGTAFLLPTYLFVGSLLVTIIGGVIHAAMTNGHPPVMALPPTPAATATVRYWLLLRVFSSGCTALTGVEAVSNGVRAFREPRVKNAQVTLTIIIAILGVLLGGISYLVKAYGIMATDPGQPGYQSVLSLLIAAVFGRGAFYYVSIASILLVLSLSANTAFADFPRLGRALAANNYMPHLFGQRGRRLVYGQGIWALAFFSAVLLIVFGGVTDRLIPLYAVGAFLAFTLSQAGMVRHWWKHRSANWRKYALINGLGAFVTGVTVIVVLVTKFVAGAWLTMLFIPLVMSLFYWVRRHYHKVAVASQCTMPMDAERLKMLKSIAVVPIDGWSRVSRQGLELACRFADEVIAVHVEAGEHSALLKEDWERYVGAPLRAAGSRVPKLEILTSPYRFVVSPVVDFVLELAEKHPNRRIVVVIPEFVEEKWYEYFLHNQRARLLEWTLLAKGNERILTVASPYYLSTAMRELR